MPHKPFIETQFPLAILSAESYKERKAGPGQTLTGLGKWWGRKPLILVRAVILGLLMPASEDAEKDREIFLRILTMDPDGLWKRKTKKLPAALIAEKLTPEEAAGFIEMSGDKTVWKRGLDPEDKARMEKLAFNRLDYEEKLAFCDRPEQIDGPSKESWREINAHLKTNAHTLQELFAELSQKAFGRTARVGDCFCGGGSIPFEAARLGLEAYGSDLNPVAALLTWAAIHLIGGGKEVQEKVRKAQEEAWEAADRQITEWGIEHDGAGNRADAYLYCIEAKSPATGLWVPLAPSWVISEKYNVIAVLKKNERRHGYDIEIITGATEKQMNDAKAGTVQDKEMVCPETKNRYGMAGLRGDKKGEDGEPVYGLRLWENEDLVPRPEDTFQERLYCVRWMTPEGDRLYKSVTEEDEERDRKVISLLKERFVEWQEKGFLPSKKIASGAETSRLFRERGWTHWHHLFHPRQLLVHGLSIENILGKSPDKINFMGMIQAIGVQNDMNSRLCHWTPQIERSGGIGAPANTFTNQALNTQYNYPIRGLVLSEQFLKPKEKEIYSSSTIDGSTADSRPADARSIKARASLWVTDPPYADAVNYHELADYFLSWYDKHLPKLFPDWYSDSRPALAVRGADEDFEHSMVDIYSNLAAHMPDDGLQVVMFTHQDAGVWADLGMILWAAGLKVTAAWTIGTETTSGLKTGNYVQGTVLLVLRKRLEGGTVFLDELYPLVDDEVRKQLDHMRRVDDRIKPQFGDTDFQLGAYAAALRVLTGYNDIEGQDIRHELFRTRTKNEKSPFEKIIDRAVSIAAGYLIPRGIDASVWRNLTNTERLYLRGLELERHGEFRQGAYQELARGFGVSEYSFMLADTVANRARFKTASEFKRVQLGEGEWGGTLLRHILFSIHESIRAENPREGFNYLKHARSDYWTRREDIQEIFKYLEQAKAHAHLSHWFEDAKNAELVRGFIANDYGGSG
ncbi:MAG: DUF1156 domain-containing protein [Spirochaetales bacterium]|nr:DUF1156 domain-containing protein [Spirochaetales bacterium]